MVQFCCGFGHCSNAGIPGLPPARRSISPSAKFGRGTLQQQASGGAISLRLSMNGTEIEPSYVGPPLVEKATLEKKRSLLARDGVCSGDWVPIAGKEDYTRPADGPQIVSSTYVSQYTQ